MLQSGICAIVVYQEGGGQAKSGWMGEEQC